MKAINFQHLAFKQFNKDLSYIGQEAIRQRALAVVSYFAVIGGGASEYNILHLMRYCGIVLNNEEHQSIMRDVLSYYCGAGLLRVIDNGLGIREMIVDKESIAFRKGEKADMTETKQALRSQTEILNSLSIERKVD